MTLSRLFNSGTSNQWQILQVFLLLFSIHPASIWIYNQKWWNFMELWNGVLFYVGFCRDQPLILDKHFITDNLQPYRIVKLSFFGAEIYFDTAKTVSLIMQRALQIHVEDVLRGTLQLYSDLLGKIHVPNQSYALGN